MRALLIAGFLLLQVALPLRYYLGDDSHDERFAWRMFSPVQMTRCSLQIEEGAERHPVRPESDVHMAFVDLMERGRPDVIDAFAARRCRKQRERGASPELYIEAICRLPKQPPRRPYEPDRNLCR
jgi:hypothetical protein